MALRKDATFLNRAYWLVLVLPVIYYFAWGCFNYGFAGFFLALRDIGLLPYCFALLALTVIHEALHVFAGICAGVSLKNFSFGFDKSSLSINCVCRQDISIGAYLFFLLLPFLLLTPSLIYTSINYDSELWRVMLVLSTSGCAFDLVVVAGILGIPRDTRIFPEFEGRDGRVYLKSA